MKHSNMHGSFGPSVVLADNEKKISKIAYPGENSCYI